MKLGQRGGCGICYKCMDLNNVIYIYKLIIVVLPGLFITSDSQYRSLPVTRYSSFSGFPVELTCKFCYVVNNCKIGFRALIIKHDQKVFVDNNYRSRAPVFVHTV